MRLLAGLAAAALAWPQGYPPGEAVARMKVAEGFRVQLVASEPEIRQPVLVKFDERGRLWAIQYLQYPNPAGLKRVKVDRYSRTTYDRIPEPPPRGPKGADRITILDGFDQTGRARRVRDFVTGLNLATGLALGHGGVFVMQVPYLLFYPDRNRDDVPDSDPEVLLEGFGMEDSQSLANHLTWGPDGWLYGLNGSTTTCRVRGVEFQQGVWRYHPVTRQFELFAEGGGNIYGLAFDAAGRLFYSSNGAALFWHAVQGGYYQKSFGKHGPLHNPHAYGYFPHVKHDGVPGGHIVLGGLIYSGESFPERYRESFIGGNFLGRSTAWWNVAARGSTVEAKLGGLLFDANDSWFCPTDLAQAPDGSIYVCDFHDARTAHPDPDAEWDLRNGRIYRVEALGTRPEAAFDLGAMSSADLVPLLKRRNRWYSEQARLILAARQDPSVWPALRELALQTADARLALEGLWALYVSGGFDPAIARQLLSHPGEHVRSWTVRLLGDARQRIPQLRELARTDPSPVVRAQLAASAKRLPATEALPVLRGLWDQNRDAGDPHIPWLIWWALESKSVAAMDLVLQELGGPEAWSTESRQEDLRRLMRRWAADGTQSAYDACAKLLAAAPAHHRTGMLQALNQGLSERAGTPAAEDTGVFRQFQTVGEISTAKPAREYELVKGALLKAISAEWKGDPGNALSARLAIRAGVQGAMQTTARAAGKDGGKMLVVLAELGDASVIPHVLPALASESSRDMAIRVLSRFDDTKVHHALLNQYAAAPQRIQDALLSRASSARLLLAAVEGGRVDPSSIPTVKLKQVAAYKDPALDALVRKHWGAIAEGTPEERLATVRRLNNDLRAGKGDPAAGKRLYLQHCGGCHKLHGEGGSLGMDLTAANRADRYSLLTHIVDPSAFIRKEYMTLRVRLRDGRTVSGLVQEQSAGGLTLVDHNHRATRIQRAEISTEEESPVSVMPEGIIEKLTPQQLRDLFAHLQSGAAVKTP